jgi:hypothetical protein
VDLIGVPSLLVPGNEPFFSGLWELRFCNGIFLTFCIGDRFFLGGGGGERDPIRAAPRNGSGGD